MFLSLILAQLTTSEGQSPIEIPVLTPIEHPNNGQKVSLEGKTIFIGNSLSVSSIEITANGYTHKPVTIGTKLNLVHVPNNQKAEITLSQPEGTPEIPSTKEIIGYKFNPTEDIVTNGAKIIIINGVGQIKTTISQPQKLYVYNLGDKIITISNEQKTGNFTLDNQASEIIIDVTEKQQTQGTKTTESTSYIEVTIEKDMKGIVVDGNKNFYEQRSIFNKVTETSFDINTEFDLISSGITNPTIEISGRNYVFNSEETKLNFARIKSDTAKVTYSSQEPYNYKVKIGDTDDINDETYIYVVINDLTNIQIPNGCNYIVYNSDEAKEITITKSDATSFTIPAKRYAILKSITNDFIFSISGITTQKTAGNADNNKNFKVKYPKSELVDDFEYLINDETVPKTLKIMQQYTYPTLKMETTKEIDLNSNDIFIANHLKTASITVTAHTYKNVEVPIKDNDDLILVRVPKDQTAKITIKDPEQTKNAQTIVYGYKVAFNEIDPSKTSILIVNDVTELSDQITVNEGETLYLFNYGEIEIKVSYDTNTDVAVASNSNIKLDKGTYNIKHATGSSNSKGNIKVAFTQPLSNKLICEFSNEVPIDKYDFYKQRLTFTEVSKSQITVSDTQNFISVGIQNPTITLDNNDYYLNEKTLTYAGINTGQATITPTNVQSQTNEIYGYYVNNDVTDVSQDTHIYVAYKSTQSEQQNTQRYIVYNANKQNDMTVSISGEQSIIVPSGRYIILDSKLFGIQINNEPQESKENFDILYPQALDKFKYQISGAPTLCDLENIQITGYYPTLSLIKGKTANLDGGNIFIANHLNADVKVSIYENEYEAVAFTDLLAIQMPKEQTATITEKTQVDGIIGYKVSMNENDDEKSRIIVINEIKGDNTISVGKEKIFLFNKGSKSIYVEGIGEIEANTGKAIIKASDPSKSILIKPAVDSKEINIDDTKEITDVIVTKTLQQDKCTYLGTPSEGVDFYKQKQIFTEVKSNEIITIDKTHNHFIANHIINPNVEISSQLENKIERKSLEVLDGKHRIVGTITYAEIQTGKTATITPEVPAKDANTIYGYYTNIDTYEEKFQGANVFVVFNSEVQVDVKKNEKYVIYNAASETLTLKLKESGSETITKTIKVFSGKYAFLTIANEVSFSIEYPQKSFSTSTNENIKILYPNTTPTSFGYQTKGEKNIKTDLAKIIPSLSLVEKDQQNKINIQNGQHFIANHIQGAKMTVKSDYYKYNEEPISDELTLVELPSTESATIDVTNIEKTIYGYTFSFEERSDLTKVKILVVYDETSLHTVTLENNEPLIIYNRLGNGKSISSKTPLATIYDGGAFEYTNQQSVTFGDSTPNIGASTNIEVTLTNNNEQIKCIINNAISEVDFYKQKSTFDIVEPTNKITLDDLNQRFIANYIENPIVEITTLSKAKQVNEDGKYSITGTITYAQTPSTHSAAITSKANTKSLSGFNVALNTDEVIGDAFIYVAFTDADSFTPQQQKYVIYNAGSEELTLSTTIDSSKKDIKIHKGKYLIITFAEGQTFSINYPKKLNVKANLDTANIHIFYPGTIGTKFGYQISGDNTIKEDLKPETDPLPIPTIEEVKQQSNLLTIGKGAHFIANHLTNSLIAVTTDYFSYKSVKYETDLTLVELPESEGASIDTKDVGNKEPYGYTFSFGQRPDLDKVKVLIVYNINGLKDINLQEAETLIIYNKIKENKQIKITGEFARTIESGSSSEIKATTQQTVTFDKTSSVDNGISNIFVNLEKKSPEKIKLNGEINVNSGYYVQKSTFTKVTDLPITLTKNSVFISSGISNPTIRIEENKLIQEYEIQGNNNIITYAETSLDTSVKLTPEVPKSLQPALFGYNAQLDSSEVGPNTYIYIAHVALQKDENVKINQGEKYMIYNADGTNQMTIKIGNEKTITVLQNHYVILKANNENILFTIEKSASDSINTNFKVSYISDQLISNTNIRYQIQNNNEPKTDITKINYPQLEVKSASNTIVLNSEEKFIANYLSISKVEVEAYGYNHETTNINEKLLSVQVPTSQKVKITTQNTQPSILGYKVNFENIEVESPRIMIIHNVPLNNLGEITVSKGQTLYIFNKGSSTITVGKKDSDTVKQVLDNEQIRLVGGNTDTVFTISKTNIDESNTDKLLDIVFNKLLGQKDVIFNFDAAASHNFYEQLSRFTEATASSITLNKDNQRFISSGIANPTIKIGSNSYSFKEDSKSKKLVFAGINAGPTASITSTETLPIYGYYVKIGDAIDANTYIYVANSAASQIAIPQHDKYIIYNPDTTTALTITQSDTTFTIPGGHYAIVTATDAEITFNIEKSGAAVSSSSETNFKVKYPNGEITDGFKYLYNDDDVLHSTSDLQPIAPPPVIVYPALEEIKGGITSNPIPLKSGEHFIANRLTGSTLSVTAYGYTHKSVTIPETLLLVDVPAEQTATLTTKDETPSSSRSTLEGEQRILGYKVTFEGIDAAQSRILIVYDATKLTKDITVAEGETMYLFNKGQCSITISETSVAIGSSLKLVPGQYTVTLDPVDTQTNNKENIDVIINKNSPSSITCKYTTDPAQTHNFYEQLSRFTEATASPITLNKDNQRFISSGIANPTISIGKGESAKEYTLSDNEKKLTYAEINKENEAIITPETVKSVSTQSNKLYGYYVNLDKTEVTQNTFVYVALNSVESVAVKNNEQFIVYNGDKAKSITVNEVTVLPGHYIIMKEQFSVNKEATDSKVNNNFNVKYPNTEITEFRFQIAGDAMIHASSDLKEVKQPTPESSITNQEPNNDSSEANEGKLGTAAIAGISVGAVAVIIVIVVCIYLFVIRKSSNNNEKEKQKDDDDFSISDIEF